MKTEAQKAANKAWRKANPDKVRAIRRRYERTEKGKAKQRRADVSVARRARRHGISAARLQGIYDSQIALCALCAICYAPFQSIRDGQLDHDHACCAKSRGCAKCVRGFLCKRCNTALGVFKDSPELLRRAAAYLDDWRMT